MILEYASRLKGSEDQDKMKNPINTLVLGSALTFSSNLYTDKRDFVPEIYSNHMYCRNAAESFFYGAVSELNGSNVNGLKELLNVRAENPREFNSELERLELHREKCYRTFLRKNNFKPLQNE